jgi:hypothetical protein
MNIGRNRKGLTNKNIGKYQEPKTLFVIASEGTVTEPLYFDAIKEVVKQDRKLNRLVEIAILSRADKNDTNSDPLAILQLLDEVNKKYVLTEGDELWLVIDRDHRKQGAEKAKIADIYTKCQQKKYEFCMTTPCFELWLVLHFKNLNDFSAEEQVLMLKNHKLSTAKSARTYLEKVLLDILGEYSKNNLDMTKFLPQIPHAIERAEALGLETAWDYEHFSTRLHILMKRILCL